MYKSEGCGDLSLSFQPVTLLISDLFTNHEESSSPREAADVMLQFKYPSSLLLMAVGILLDEREDFYTNIKDIRCR